MSKSISRRNFVASSAAMAAAPAFLNAQATGSRIAIGWVGLGNRGGRHINTMMEQAGSDGYIKAICEAFAPRLAKGKDDVASKQGQAPDECLGTIGACVTG